VWHCFARPIIVDRSVYLCLPLHASGTTLRLDSMAAGTWQDVLPFVAHCLCNQPKVISMLLCTSRTAAQLIEQSCTGSIEVCCQLRNRRQAQQIAAFLARHTGLLNALDVQLPEHEGNKAVLEHLLAAALGTVRPCSTNPAAEQIVRMERICAGIRNIKQQQQQQQEHQPLLQSFSCNSPSNVLLHQVSASCSSSLARLTVSMQLTMDEDDALAAAGAVASFRSLPNLSMTFITEQTPLMTRLTLVSANQHSQARINCTAAMLSALSQLSQLTQLQLKYIYTSSSSSSSAECVTQAIARLRNLRSLELWSVALDDAAAAAQLGAAPAAAALTRLQLQDCELDDHILRSIKRSMSSLQQLDVSGNLLLTDAALALIAERLPQLVELDASFTSITRAACSSLQSARPGLTGRAGRRRRWVRLHALIASDCCVVHRSCVVCQWCCLAQHARVHCSLQGGQRMWCRIQRHQDVKLLLPLCMLHTH
jgi:hypothetical protein